MKSFVYNGLATRVVFGAGTLTRLPEEIERLGLERVLVLSTPGHDGQAHDIAKKIGAHATAVFSDAAMHTPVEVTHRAMGLVAELSVDGIVAVGGGSTTGLGKAIALRTDLPQVVIPTTYAGSEMTPILGETANGLKTTIRSPKVQPEVVIYDVELTLSLPPSLSGVSGINAIAHAAEALYAQDANPVTDLMAVAGIAALGRSLPRIAADPRDLSARSDALYGAWLCGICLGQTAMGLHHKLCHTLGGAFDLPHAETHTIILPHALAYNAPAIPDAMRRIAASLGVEDAAEGIYDLATSVGAKHALGDIGMPAASEERAADLALANPYSNPRPLERGGILELIANAYRGTRP